MTYIFDILSEFSVLENDDGLLEHNEYLLDSQSLPLLGRVGLNPQGIGFAPLPLPISIPNFGFSFSGPLLATPTLLGLVELDGTTGFNIPGLFLNGQNGFSVAGIGDINNDGIDDFALGAPSGGVTGNGVVYVVFGTGAGFPVNFDLTTLNGVNGFRIDGLNPGDFFGGSISAAGDMNGDGIADFIIGAPQADPGGTSTAGAAFVIFGQSTAFAPTLDLTTLNGTNGFSFTGLDLFGRAGTNVAGLGDINGDGFDDVMISAPFGGPGDQGEAYVILGTGGTFIPSYDPSTVVAFGGFIITGLSTDDNFGIAASGIGDFNGDGIDDFIVSAPSADVGATVSAGQIYLVFGNARDGFGASLDLSTLAFGRGIVFEGVSFADAAGDAVSGAGDINNDGIADIIIGAPNIGSQLGGAYVVFGSTARFPANFDLSTLDGTNGFFIQGLENGSDTGFSVAAAGDFNGDGIDDLVISAPDAGSGAIFLIFGTAGGFASTIDLTTLDGTNGTRIDGVAFNDEAGFSVASAGDINGDGMDDLVIGARVVDAGGLTNSGQSYIVFGFNPALLPSPPIAVGDSFTTDEETPTTGNVLADNGNGVDSDLDGDPLTVISVNGAAANVGTVITGSRGGLFTIASDGTFTFDPNGDFEFLNPSLMSTRETSVTYTIDDGTGLTSTATVSVVVTGVNDAPTATPDSFTTNSLTSLIGNVMSDDNGAGIDSDPDGSITVRDVNGVPVDVGRIVAGSNGGTFIIYAHGGYVFQPAGDFDGLGAGQTADTSVTYTITDGFGATSTATVTVTVLDGTTNIAPVAREDIVNAGTASIATGSVFWDNGFGPDEDADGDVITVSQVNSTGALVGTAVAGDNGGLFTINADGTYTFDPNGEFTGLSQGQSAFTSVSYTIDDGNGGSSDTQIVIQVFVGVVGRFALQDDDLATDSNTTIAGNVLGDNGNGPDEGVTRVDLVNSSFSAVGTQVAGDNGGLFTINRDGSYSFDPNSDFAALAPGETVLTTVQYQAFIGDGVSEPGTVTVAVTGAAAAGNPPVAQDDTLNTNEDTVLNGNVFADNGNGVDSDRDGDTFFVSQVNGVSTNVSMAVAGSAGGLFTINADGSYNFEPNGEFETLATGDSATTTITYTIDDALDGTSTATVTVTVNGVNDAPVAIDDSFVTDEDNAVGGNVFDANGAGADSDIDTGDAIAVSAVNGASSNVGINVVGSTGGVFIIQANGVFSFQPNGDYDTLAVGESAVSTATYTIDDGNGGTSTASVTVTINGANDAPFGVNVNGIVSANPVPGQNVLDGAPITALDLSAFIKDIDASDTLTITVDIAALPPGLLYDLVTNTISGTPTTSASQGGPNSDGIYTVQVTGTDNNGASFVTNVIYTVANPAPIARSDAFVTNESSIINGSVFADNGSGADSDADGDGFSVRNVNGASANVGTAIAGSAGGLFTINADGTYSFDPNGEFNGLNNGDSQDTTITYTIDDEEGGSSTTTVTVTVNGVTGVNTAPVAQDDALATDQDTLLNGDVFADNGNGFDDDADGDVFSVTAVGGVAAHVATPVAGTGGGLFTINSDGSFNFNPNDQFNDLAAGASTNSTITYTIDDGNGGSDTATVTVTINGVNDAPTANDAVLAVDENLPAGTIVGTVMATDIDMGDVLGYAITGGNTNTAFAVDANGQITTLVPLDFEALDNYNLTIVVTDTGGLTDTANVTINVGDVNEAPAAVDDTISGTPANNSFNLLADNGNGVDSDPDGDDTLTITQINGIAVVVGSTITLANSLVLTVTGNGIIELNTLQPGIYNEVITYTVDDGNGLTSTATVTARFEVNGFDLANTNTNGVIINGVGANDESGFAVSTAGDINNDGFDDFLIGAHFAGPDAGSDAGVAYVIFGGPNGPAPLGQNFDLADLDGTNGFMLTGIDQFDNAAWSVASAGDVNGDGIDDLIISGHLADPNGGQSGEVYIVFGGTNFGAEFNLGDLDGSNGFIINGIDAVDQAGYSVSGAGDVNGDGINDILIGARGADPGGLEHAGETYVVFGTAAGFPAVLELADLDGTNGFVINGIDAEDFSGFAVSGVGDVNGDGLADILIGAPGAEDGTGTGEAYIVFGSAAGFSASLNLSTLNGTNGFTITGLRAGDGLGFSVSGGDFNGDGIEDILIGALGQGSEQAFVIFGAGAGFSANFDLSTLDGSNGFAITGGSGLAETGFAVTSVGDFDGDGFDDFVVSAPAATANGNGGAGQAYLVYGQASGFGGLLDLNTLNGSSGFVLGGIAAGDNAGFSVAAAGDVNGDGLADILIGAPGASANGVAGAGQSYLIYGFVSGPHNLTGVPSPRTEDDEHNTPIVEAVPNNDESEDEDGGGDGNGPAPGFVDSDQLFGNTLGESFNDERVTVVDFTQDIDVLEIQSSSLANFATVKAVAQDGMDDNGQYVALDLGDDGMFIIYGLSVATMSENDFSFDFDLAGPMPDRDWAEFADETLSATDFDVMANMLMTENDNSGDNFNYTDTALAPRDSVALNADLSGTDIDLSALADFLVQDDNYANVFVNSEGVLEIGSQEDMLSPPIDPFDFG